MKIQNIALAAFCLIILTAVSIAQETPAKSKNDKSKYNQILKKLNVGDTKVDFQALRFSFTETKKYSPYGCEHEKLFESFNKKKYKKSVKAAKNVLKNCYVSIDAHLVAAISNRELKKTKEFEFHKAVYEGLLNSIVSNGDGKTAKTAWTVISVDEEYAVLRSIGFRMKGQATTSEDGSRFDVLDAIDMKDPKNTGKFYFNIDFVFRGYGKMFEK